MDSTTAYTIYTALLEHPKNSGWHKKYKTEDVGMKKFIAGKFLDFRMIDAMTVINQI